jgi:thiol:disulfide interchange protein
MNSMKFKVIIVLTAALAGIVWLRNVRGPRVPQHAAVEAGWMTDAPAALAKARNENKTVVMDFTGSDWCGWCIRLDEEVFSTAEFASYAKENLVLLKLDFPRGKKLSATETQQNERLAQQYGIRGFPTIVVLRPDGGEMGRLGYQPGGPKPWLESLRALR